MVIDGAGRGGQRRVLGEGASGDANFESGSHLWALHLLPHMGMCIHNQIDIQSRSQPRRYLLQQGQKSLWRL